MSRSVHETVRCGKATGRALAGGELLALAGPLGSGKTHLVKGIAAGCGVPESQLVNSPTFVLINEYRGRLDVLHIDAYRLVDPEDLERLGLSELIQPSAVVLIEWADKVSAALGAFDPIWIHLSHRTDSERRIEFPNPTPALEATLEHWNYA